MGSRCSSIHKSTLSTLYTDLWQCRKKSLIRRPERVSLPCRARMAARAAARLEKVAMARPCNRRGREGGGRKGLRGGGATIKGEAF